MSNYGKCHYCKLPMTRPTAKNHHPRMATRDHVVPASLGGTKTVPCCLKCNGLKADMLPQQWSEFRAKNPTWFWESFRPNMKYTKAAERAEIFRKLRISRISPAWPAGVFVQRRPLCRGLA